VLAAAPPAGFVCDGISCAIGGYFEGRGRMGRNRKGEGKGKGNGNGNGKVTYGRLGR
jgi:hypothetical protein